MKRPSADWASVAAEQVLERKILVQLPIDPIAIAESEGISVMAKPVNASGVSGVLIRVGSDFAIGYATHIRNQGYQRFSIAHELGHFYLPGHIDAVFAAGAGVHQSRAGYQTTEKYESEADEFASGLLMPGKQFKNELLRASDGLDGVHTLKTLFNTSLTATAIRYTKFATLPVAIVVSENDIVSYSFMSDAMKDFRGLLWLKKGYALPIGVATRAFNRERSNVLQGRREDAVARISDWFGSDIDFEISEEIVGLGNYGRTLTILTCESFADEVEDEDSDTHHKPPWERD